MPLATGSKLGPYEIRSLLGIGGMGEAYRAHDARLNRDVAIKVLPAAFSSDSERMARFEREAQLLASLNHPHIAALYGLEEQNGIRALVMELVEGPTLAMRIGTAPLAVEDALPIAVQVADALECAHERGVIHRDLKPANVKLTPDGTAKVLDFGLAKMLDNAESNLPDPANSPTFASATKMGVVLGTAAYMSPEQAKGKSVDRRTDIWSFGCVLYEMLSGKQAFSGETITEILAAVVRSEPEWSRLPQDTPAALEALLRRCLQKNPKERLRDIGDARIELKQLLSPSSSHLNTTVFEADTLRRRGRHLLPWAITAIVCLSALAGWFVSKAQGPAHPAVARFAITLPHMPEFGEMAISPDGSAIVFDTVPGSGPVGTKFVLRKIDQLSTTPIAGTEESWSPSFSPDGKWLLFANETGLHKLKLNSATSNSVYQGKNLEGACWLNENTILFSQYGRGLFKISADGGTPELVAEVGALSKNRDYMLPSIVPGGKFAVVTLSPLAAYSDAQQDIALVRTDRQSSEPMVKIVVSGASSGRYVAPGFILFTRGNSLFATPFDVSHQTAVGSPRMVLDGVKIDRAQPSFYFDVSASGTLIYSPPLEQKRLPVLVNRNGTEQSLNVAPRRYWDPQLSRDGKLLAFSIDSGADHQNVWVYNLERRTWIRLGFDQRQEMAPVWSPDGRRVYYVTNDYKLLSRMADGSGAEEVLHQFPIWFFPTSVSPDGHTLAGHEYRESNLNLITIRFNDKGAIEGEPSSYLSTPAMEWRGQFSPDGHWLAYASNETGDFEVYVREYPGPGGKWQVSSAGGDEPRWAANGRELFYRKEDAMMVVEVRATPTFTTGPPRVLFKGAYETSASVASYVVTPDAQKFVMLKKEGESSPPEVDVVMNWTAELQK